MILQLTVCLASPAQVLWYSVFYHADMKTNHPNIPLFILSLFRFSFIFGKIVNIFCIIFPSVYMFIFLFFTSLYFKNKICSRSFNVTHFRSSAVVNSCELLPKESRKKGKTLETLPRSFLLEQLMMMGGKGTQKAQLLYSDVI